MSSIRFIKSLNSKAAAELPEPTGPYYLGLDLGIKGAHFAATQDGETFSEGQVTLDGFLALMARFKPAAVGMEYSGRLAEQWCLACLGNAIPAFILHSVMRKALNRLQRVTAKTDPADARSIARNLRLWHDEARRKELGLPPDLFTDAETTRGAWTLRAYLADAESLVRVRTAAKQRLLVAERLNMPERAVLWAKAATAEDAEEAYHKARAYAEEYFGEALRLLLTVPGIGEASALSIIGYLLPLDRFIERGPKGEDKTFANIRRYVGFHPVKRQSGSINEEHKAAPRGQSRLRSVLTMGARGACHPKRTDRFARQYQGLVAAGMKPSRGVNRVATAMLRVSVAVLRSSRAFEDPADPKWKPPKEPKEPKPAHLLPQPEAARSLGVSRQRVGQMIDAGQLRAEEWEGRRYVVARSLDAALERRKPLPQPPDSV